MITHHGLSEVKSNLAAAYWVLRFDSEGTARGNREIERYNYERTIPPMANFPIDEFYEFSLETRQSLFRMEFHDRRFHVTLHDAVPLIKG